MVDPSAESKRMREIDRDGKADRDREGEVKAGKGKCIYCLWAKQSSTQICCQLTDAAAP